MERIFTRRFAAHLKPESQTSKARLWQWCGTTSALPCCDICMGGFPIQDEITRISRLGFAQTGTKAVGESDASRGTGCSPAYLVSSMSKLERSSRKDYPTSPVAPVGVSTHKPPRL